MIDFLHLPKPQNGYIDYFPGFSTTAGGQWEVWNKPRGINFINIICIGGGGGGGAAANVSGRTGGGGGGSGTISRVTMPAIILPDRLYVSSGVGGLGGTTLNGSNGVSSFVSIAQNIGAIYVVCAADRGGAGNYAGSGGSGGVAFTISNCLQSSQGNFTSISGQNGGAGGSAAGTSITYPTTGLLLSGGAGGGGGTAAAGGNITAPASQTDTYTILPTISGGVAGTAGSLPGGDGSPGVNNMELLLFSGGSGGGSGFDTSAGAIGGRGGDGGFGCGGAGGGGGTTAGRGGNGGPGLVIISCW